MKALVTGSSGWLGRHLLPLIRETGHDGIGLDLVPGPETNIVGSVTDRGFLGEVFAAHRFDAVIHAAALHKPDIARFSERSFIDVNIGGTLNLLACASERPGVRFVFTSTTSLMISRAIREGRYAGAVWIDEQTGPLAPRNIYGVTKLAAEGLCRLRHLDTGMDVVILRTARFFPEEDDTIRDIPGANLKANELLHRRATVRDMARAHIAAMEKAGDVGFGLYIVSAPTPFTQDDLGFLKADAASLIERSFPGAAGLYSEAGWRLPASIDRVYDGSRIVRELGFDYETGFKDVLSSLRQGAIPPVEHNPGYISPIAGVGGSSRSGSDQ
ncbi:MAG: NAD(P)-dependent oxidoreductase [Alphaproteobacteria bacterium]|nr:NAD(P)-dependent oxidoreductase [Alphaproteobacteria bacterium]